MPTATDEAGEALKAGAIAPADEGASTDETGTSGEASGDVEGDLKSIVMAELESLRDLAASYTSAEVRDGTWLVRFMRNALTQYAETVNAEYFLKKYPGLPPDVIVERRVSLAKKFAAIEGGLSAAAYTGVMAATLGSGGTTSPATLPAAALTFVVDLFYVTRLQLKLAYDISTLYGCPLDMDDAEDMYDFIAVAFGVKAIEALREGATRFAPELARAGVRAAFHSGALTWMRALPIIGKHLLQKNVIKFAIPAVGIPLSAGLNYFSTGRIAKVAQQVFRDKASIEEAAQRIAELSDVDPLLVLKAVFLVVRADGEVKSEESWLLRGLVSHFADTEGSDDALASFQRLVTLDEPSLFTELKAAAPEVRAQVYEAAVHAAATDHKVHAKEKLVLKRLAKVCGAEYDEDAIEEKARASIV